MRFKIDREFYTFCSLMPKKDMTKVSMELANEFETADIEYPVAVSDRIYEFSIEETQEKLRQYFNIYEITDAMWKAFLDCTLIGDGDCPECGGYMEWSQDTCEDEFEGRGIFGEEKFSHHYFSIYTCPDCRHQEKR